MKFETPEDLFDYFMKTRGQKAIADTIDATVNTTVLKLKAAGLMKDNRKSAFQKTEELLRNYNAFKKSDQPYAKTIVNRINDALYSIKDDPYYDLIPMIYFEEKSREYIAEDFDTTVTTVSRNKTRLVNKLKAMLFSDDTIYELFLQVFTV